jgi:hypothetical protein
VLALGGLDGVSSIMGQGTYIFGEEVAFAVVVDVDAGVSALETEWAFASYVGVFSTYAVTCSDAYLGFAVVGAVYMHPKHIFVCLFVEHDLGSLDNATWTSVAGCRTCEECTFVVPFYEIGGRVAVDVDERCAVGLVFTDPEMVSTG